MKAIQRKFRGGKTPAVRAAVGVFLAAAALAVLSSCSRSGKTPSTGGGGGELSADQKRVVARLGEPDAFDLAFPAATADGRPRETRQETWYYYQVLTCFRFVDGKFVSSSRIDKLPGGYVASGHRPGQFHPGMTPGQARTLLGSRRCETLAVGDMKLGMDSLKGLSVLFSERIILGFDGERLACVQAMAGVPRAGGLK